MVVQKQGTRTLSTSHNIYSANVDHIGNEWAWHLKLQRQSSWSQSSLKCMPTKSLGHHHRPLLFLPNWFLAISLSSLLSVAVTPSLQELQGTLYTQVTSGCSVERPGLVTHFMGTDHENLIQRLEQGRK
jgi:hypothetical protein